MAIQTKDRPTYSELAKVAGVSQATVSRVLNGDERVRPDRIEAVNRAVRKLGYKKNRAAAALASGRTGLIAVVIDDDLSVFSDPFWGAVTTGISKVLMKNDMQTLLLVAPLNRLDSPVSHYLQRGEVDGAIFLQLKQDALISSLDEQGLPLVVVGTPHTSRPFPFVDSDNASGAYRAIEHFNSKGRKTVAMITGELSNTAAEQRLEGYLAAINRFGLKSSKTLVKNGDWSRESGYRHMKAILKANPNVDAVFCSNDAMALGAMTAIEQAGKSIPEDVAVIGFDDSALAKNAHPALTSVKQDIIGLGEETANLILARINGEEVHSEILGCKLVIRESA